MFQSEDVLTLTMTRPTALFTDQPGCWTSYVSFVNVSFMFEQQW